MTKGEAKQLLDALIELQENHMRLQNMYREEGVLPSTSFFDGEVHIHIGLDVLAEALKEGILEEKGFSEDYPYGYYFTYRGYKVFQLSKKERPEWKN